MNRVDPSDLVPLLRPWNLGEPDAVTRLGGSNNASWRVVTQSGAYVLRLYRNRGNLPHVDFEHALLGQLSQRSLSFKVPAPLPSRSGRTLEQIEVGSDVHWVAVSNVIEGEHPRDWTAPRWVRAAGAALGELDAALAETTVPSSKVHLPTYSDLDRIHAVVPDPEAAVAGLPLDEPLTHSFIQCLERARSNVVEMYATLPHQIIHSDLDGSNLLFLGDQVSGILDFEFASPDVRAMDFAIAVVQTAVSPELKGLELDVVGALAGGYGAAARLTPSEIEAIPDLLRLRGAVSVIHRLGRWKSGLSPLGAVESRIRHNIALDRWLETHRDALVSAVAAGS